MKDNKLIAEFMGLSHCEEGWITIPNENRNGVSENEISNDLQYHTSWDWLMPVVEKIEEIAIEDDNLTIKEHRYQVDMGYTQCNIYDHVKDCVVASGDMGSKRLSTHKAVVEFIKEHNK